MRRFCVILFFLSFLQIGTKGQINKEISLAYNANDFNLETIDGKVCISSPVYPLIFMSDTLAPALPYIGVNVLVNKTENYNSFSCIEQLFANNVEIALNPKEVPCCLNPSYDTTCRTVFDSNIYPENSVIFEGSHHMDGFSYLSFLVCPFKYDTENQILSLYSTITLTISLSNETNAPNINQNEITGLSMRSVVKDIIVNKTDLDSMYSLPLTPPSINYEYVIVTNDTLKNSFQNLADWKTLKGVRAKVLTTAEIDSTYQGSTQQIRIKKALKDYYNESHQGLKYALLGGDLSVVPSQNCFIKNSGYVDTTPTDLFYACFDTMDWDNNENGILGELQDSIDIDPEIIVTRLPVSTPTDADNIIERIINYEKGCLDGIYYKKILMAGVKLGSFFIIDNDTVSDAQYKGNIIYHNFIEPYWDGTRVRFYDTDTDFSNGKNYELNSSNLQLELSKGYCFVNMDTHGNSTCWGMESGSYTLDWANALHNMGNTIITTSACNTNRIDDNTCLSKSFMKNPNGNILGYFGSSRYGWYYKGIKDLGPSDNYNSQLYKSLFTSEDLCFGRATQKAKSVYIGNCKSYTSHRWLMFSINPLCDPEMPVYLSEPQTFSDVNLSMSGDSLTVNTGSSNCRIVAMSISDGGESYYKSVESETGCVTFPNFISGYRISIIKPGYIPYIVEYSDVDYIQNEIINENKHIWANNVLIGSDVTSNLKNGNVSIESGSTIIYGSNVTIQNDFEVKLGAKLCIKIFK